MSKSVLLKSSLAKKYWMALTGLFLCLFLVGHLLGNLQLLKEGDEARRAFNEYGYFMTHNIFIKILSYLTYISILFHAIDGILLTVQNVKARPVAYVSNNAKANSTFASRNMALLGSLILIFIVTHMANFWWKVKFSSDPMPLHTVKFYPPMSQNPDGDTMYLTTAGNFLPANQIDVKHGNELHVKDRSAELAQMYPGKTIGKNPKFAEGYKDMYSLVYTFFGHDRSENGYPKSNEFALLAVILYTLSMLALSYHLMHGFASAFQSLGLRHPAYTKIVKYAGYGFSIIVPLMFAIIPIYIYLIK